MCEQWPYSTLTRPVPLGQATGFQSNCARGGSNRPLKCWNCREPGHIGARCLKPMSDCTSCGERGTQNAQRGRENRRIQVQPELIMLPFLARLLNIMMVCLLICRLQGRRSSFWLILAPRYRWCTSPAGGTASICRKHTCNKPSCDYQQPASPSDWNNWIRC